MSTIGFLKVQALASVGLLKALSILAVLLSAGALGATFLIPGPQGPQGTQGNTGPTGPQGPSSTQYKPAPQTRQFYILVIPDMGGNGYDKFEPSTITVNQNDIVSITIRNTDTMPHGFDLSAYSVHVPIASAFNATTPTDTIIPNFNATTPGVFVFYCYVPCGTGHGEMMGYFTVLPRSTS